MQSEFGAVDPHPLLTVISCADALQYPERSRGSTIPGKVEDLLDPAALGWDFLVIWPLLLLF